MPGDKLAEQIERVRELAHRCAEMGLLDGDIMDIFTVCAAAARADQAERELEAARKVVEAARWECDHAGATDGLLSAVATYDATNIRTRLSPATPAASEGDVRGLVEEAMDALFQLYAAAGIFNVLTPEQNATLEAKYLAMGLKRAQCLVQSLRLYLRSGEWVPPALPEEKQP